jgi:hypothetical protein
MTIASGPPIAVIASPRSVARNCASQVVTA